MNSSNLKEKNKYKGWVKYFIFNVIFLCAVFAFGGVDFVNAAGPTYEIHESNHAGNNTNSNPNAAINVDAVTEYKSYTGYGSVDFADTWYVQGTGDYMKDVITVTIEMEYKAINGLVVYESNHTTGAAGEKNYDSYKKINNSWVSLFDSDYATNKGLAPGVVFASDSTTCQQFASAASLSTDLKANSTSGDYYSMLCINEDADNNKITVKYAYTIRNIGYGLKQVYFVFYNDDGYGGDDLPDPQMVATRVTVDLTVSKPIDENDFTWIGGKDGDGNLITDCGTNFHGDASSANKTALTTNNVCVTYNNYDDADKTTIAQYLKITLPKETAYIHDVSTEKDDNGTPADTDDDIIKIGSIKDNTIFGTNSFINFGSTTANVVKYYYYNFLLVDSVTKGTTDSVGSTTGDGNREMSSFDEYVIALEVDASGDYYFYVTDLFGNKFTSGKVDVEDVSKTNIIVDFTNEVALNIMNSSGYYQSNDWRQSWTFSIDSPNVVNFTKMAKDEIDVEIYIFQKIVIDNGVFGGNGTDGSDTTGIEDIAKQPLGYEDGDPATVPNEFNQDGIKIWRVADLANDDSTNDEDMIVSCETNAELLCVNSANVSYSTGDYSGVNTTLRKNKLTFTAKSNGRYRIMVTDNYGNTTNTLSDEEKNPKVEISVIDRTTPIVGRENGNAEDGVLTSTEYENSINSFAYVIGGGEQNPVNPSDSGWEDEEYWKDATNYTTIYYNAAGSKIFNYQDALEIAGVKTLDPVMYYSGEGNISYFSSYNVNFGANASTCLDVTTGNTSALAAGGYCDPAVATKSDRNGSGTSYNLHSYIISNNLTSFSAGLVKQVGYTDYNSSTNTNVYASLDSNAPTANKNVEYVNKKDATTFLGYLKIQFKTSTGGEICTLSIDNANDAADTSSGTNQSCFEMMNKYIDEVEDFKMVFTAQDYNNVVADRHTSSEFTVTVKIVDTTAPGIDMSGADDANSIEYSNEETICRLEIDNLIQVKESILNCYKLKVSGSYKFKDNNIDHTASYADEDDAGKKLDSGVQYYAAGGDTTSGDYYHQKIQLSILEEGDWMVIGDNAAAAGFPHLYKSGYHQIKIQIFDHWDVTYDELQDGATDIKGNVLTVYGTFYVNPRTLLIEPLATEKMYGEAEPTFDYCVYVNRTNATFNLEGNFFEVDFINTYFTYIYCTRDVYAEIVDDNRYSKTVKTDKAYNYNLFAQDDAGEYLKINNTYVLIDAAGANRYNMEYVAKTDGEYLKVDTDYYEIKSGYVYTNDTCLYAVTDGTINDKYLKLPNGTCQKIEVGNRYTEKYTQSNSGTYLKYNLNTISSAGYDNVSGNANEALVNSNIFNGKLARVESRCYNGFSDNYHSNTEETNFATYVACDENSTETDKDIRNDNVGRYHMVLGTLSVKEDTGTAYNEDYVIKINTNYVSNSFQLGGAQTITKAVDNVLVDDGLKTESTVYFTIRQAVLTIRANGSSKSFGEQDPYSQNWNDVTTPTNIVNTTGYLKGYTVEGWRYNGNSEDETDTEIGYIIKGTLRREVGEEVGIYDICNISGNPKEIDAAKCRADVVTPGVYDTTNIYYFAAYDHYATDGASTEAALTIRTNAEIYGDGAGRKLNTDTRNYAISFVKADFKIEAINLVVQPGINQGKEYAKTAYNDPLWQLVVYGETIVNDSGIWKTNVDVDAASGFSGYTAKIEVEENTKEQARGYGPYRYDNADESEVYYARRKVSPNNVTYQYTTYVDLNAVGLITYTKEGNYYYQSNAAIANGQYVYAYGQYFEIVAANRYTSSNVQSNDGTKLKIVVNGRLVNETYSLFDVKFASDDGNKLYELAENSFKLERTTGENVGWYSYTRLYNYKEVTIGGNPQKVYTIRKVANNYKECAIGTDTVATAVENGTVDCRNYNVVYRDNAPQTLKDGDDNIIGYNTVEGDTDTTYKPDGEHSCDSGYYSLTCGATNKNIKFEIFKREIILEFIDYNYTFIYGQRYNYYDGGEYRDYNESTKIYSNYKYNSNEDGIFHIDDATSEKNIFLCYSDLGDYLVDCTSNTDYGITSGDTWTSIGLKFYLHSVVSGTSTTYYDLEKDHKAVPAGTYYVYAAIGQLTENDTATGTSAETMNNTIHLNYKFTYRGGTLTIAPKVTNVQLMGYTMEYGETKYDSYGVGSNYTDYTSYGLSECMVDTDYLVDNNGDVITSLMSNCSVSDNVVGNKYGFVIEGLDVQDTIANNFTGRPVRVSRNAGNVGYHDDVGYYKIGVGSIKTINNPLVSLSNFKECTTNLTGGVVTTLTDCVFVGNSAAATGTVTGTNAVNYNIDYSIANNEGAHLFILPANLEITVYENQTKMYGCAYSIFTTGVLDYYQYTYKDGYANCDSANSWDVDLAYKYNVSGDKDTLHTTGVLTSKYDVTTKQNGTRVFYREGSTSEITLAKSILTDDRLYRVTYNANVTADYADVKNNYSNYQGQSVGVYTISLGNLNITQNSNAMCDAYNNPVLEGGSACRNYNINYYGNSSTIDIDDHIYNDKDTIDLGDLTLYTLNYTSNSSGNYVLIDGKFVHLSAIKRFDDAQGNTANNASGAYALISKYVATSSLPKYKKLPEYQVSTTCASEGGCYIYLKDSTIKNAGNEEIAKGYVLLDSLASYRYTDVNGSTQSNTGDYLKVTNSTGTTRYIKISTITTFKKNTDAYSRDDSNGEYVFINNKYVQLSSLQKYTYDETTKLYTAAAAGTYVQIYEYATIASLDRYTLDASEHNMYTVIESGNVSDNLYVFVNGSYIPYNSLIKTSGQTTVDLNSANITESETVKDKRGSVTSDVKFTITARIVYVHPEYNVKPYDTDDPVEYITCKEISTAYGLTTNGQTGGRTYCSDYTSDTEKIELGTTMYYAVQNSLAKAPWTSWTDTNQSRATYNDIQFDVLSGMVSRMSGEDAGKYTFDFGNVTTNDAFNGKNYMIQYVTTYDLDHTYIKVANNGNADDYATIGSKIYETCNYGDDHCIATSAGTGKKLINNAHKLPMTAGIYSAAGTSTSLSLIQKYSSTSVGATIPYWYQGFYVLDNTDGRSGELAKWWTDRTYFSTSYDTFKVNNAAKDGSGNYFNGTREVYFEIIKRTIYLYAVDVEKTYGEADKYSDFLVAICPNALGYINDGNGKIKCASDHAQSNAHGFGSDDKAIFVESATGYMKQWQIKHDGDETDYMFAGKGSENNHFGIYFRRQNGENAGSYTITACAMQDGVKDCTYEVPRTSPNYNVLTVGDNYEIIEISGVLTIKTREVNITPDSDQGFVYGNYTENGSMPNITFTEARDDKNENGLVFGSGTYLFKETESGGSTTIEQIAQITKVQNASDKYTSLYTFTLDSKDYIIDGRKVIDEETNTVVTTIAISTTDNANEKTITIGGTTYKIVQKASCLINISGIYTVCISDGQNESLINSLGENYYEWGASYVTGAVGSTVYDGSLGNDDATRATIVGEDKQYYSYNVYADSYSDPANEYTRTETTSASGSTTENTRNALNLKCGNTNGLRYSRDVCDYKIVSGELKATNVMIEKQTTFYIYITDSKRYSKNATTGEYTKTDLGSWIKYGNDLYAEIKDSDRMSYVCEVNATTHQLECEYEADTEGEYLKVVVSSNNYRVKSIDETVVLSITSADIKVTPVDKQYKIYGEADIELKFTVETTFIAARTQFQKFANANIVKMCNNIDPDNPVCYEGNGLNTFRYGAISSTTVNESGDFILIPKGWEVTLNSYAYDEEVAVDKTNNLDYGVNYDRYKHTTTSSALSQKANDVKHYDKYTTYNNEIATTRILIGNLYYKLSTKEYDQTVGEKNIVNGLKVGVNKLAAETGNTDAKNYNLSFDSTVLFVIIPRPVNVEIENITKVYGQATDHISCDNRYKEDCIVGDGILIEDDSDASGELDPNEDSNDTLLINNYNVLDKDLSTAIGATAVSGVLTKTLDSSNVSGISVVYMSSATDYSKMNMPTITSKALVDGDTYKNYVTVSTGSYYTELGTIERKNNTLNIKVQRGTDNIARGASSTCLVTGETLCEDVGEYYLSFTTRTAGVTKEGTIANGYYNEYWGYNKNYYVILYNNFEASGWSEMETKSVADGGQGYVSVTVDNDLHTYTDTDANPGNSATLKIRKRPIQIVAETISEYTPSDSAVATGTHLRVGTEGNYVYHLITETNTYIIKDGKYVQSKIDPANTGTTYYLCTYAKVNSNTNCHEIKANSRFNLTATTVGEKYSIEENTDVPTLVGVSNDKTKHHTTYDTSNYENITWYEHPLQVRANDALTGEVAYCQDKFSLGSGVTLDTLRTSSCSSAAELHYYDADGNINKENEDNFFETTQSGHYIITREKNKLYITNANLVEGTANGVYEANNYTTTFWNGILQIDIDETAPIINVDSDFIIKEANSGYMSKDTIDSDDDVLGFLDSLKTNGCAGLVASRDEDKNLNTCTGIVFTYEDENKTYPTGITPTISNANIKTLLEWFGIDSFDPGIMRAGIPLDREDRYHPRWYMAIQYDFDQKKVGDYTIFIYAQDDVGNISLASTVTLRIVDNTAPTTGTVNLYNAEVKCKPNTDCNNEDNWVVAANVYLPINSLSTENLSAITDRTKYAYTGKVKDGAQYKLNFVENAHFGTYYLIPAETNAKAVKHSGWTNTAAGIYMTITGGDDNSLAYLDISKYTTKYTISGDTITEEATSPTHLLLGSFVNVANLTKYRQAKVDANGDEVTGARPT